MQLLTTQCPYCKHEVETTLDLAQKPIQCPHCGKPFEVEIPTAGILSVREVSDSRDTKKMAAEPGERTIHNVHPVIFRSRPVASLIILGVVGASLYGLFIALTHSGSKASNTNAEINSWSSMSLEWLLWLSVAALIFALGCIFYWIVDSLATTLTITDVRTIFKKGIIQRYSSEVQHDDVRNIQVNQSLFQRLLNIGEIGISSSGQDDLEIVAKRLPGPGVIVQTIRDHQE